ncbi:fimbrial protein [Lelliottia sp. SL45]|uniref:fimbrial protein n=1 Tax=Lelliottia sp. SL45 TaxID=2994665 RepID=UPI002275FFB8|nr:fimbrial protein [Lelliottia sp. SL45]MCY1700968.1 fimbrial protein [Lelliottia sp. SL45]
MKKSIIALTLSVSSSVCFAAGQGAGNVTFTGTVIDAPCSITPDSVDQTIDLGQISLAKLANGTSNNGISTPVEFTIQLEDCSLAPAPALNTVTATFSGPEGDTPGLLGITGSAKGASVALYNEDSSPLILGAPSKPKPLILGSNTLAYSAAVVGDGSSTLLSAGDFTATASFELTYD